MGGMRHCGRRTQGEKGKQTPCEGRRQAEPHPSPSFHSPFSPLPAPWPPRPWPRSRWRSPGGRSGRRPGRRSQRQGSGTYSGRDGGQEMIEVGTFEVRASFRVCAIASTTPRLARGRVSHEAPAQVDRPGPSASRPAPTATSAPSPEEGHGRRVRAALTLDWVSPLSLAPFPSLSAPTPTATTHHTASQLSHLRFWPGGGGVSEKRRPSESRTPADQKDLAGPPPARARAVPPTARAARARRPDIERRGVGTRRAGSLSLSLSLSFSWDGDAGRSLLSSKKAQTEANHGLCSEVSLRLFALPKLFFSHARPLHPVLPPGLGW